MRDTDKKITLSAGLMMVMIAVYFVVICMINFSGVPSFYDTDMYADMYYAVHVWQEKTLFPENWVFGNQLYAFSAPVLAALFYGMLGSPHLAMGLASTVMSLWVMFSLDWMLRPVFKTRESRLAAILLLMASVLFCGKAVEGNIGWSMLFTMCSYYSGYVIAACLAFGCYLRPELLTSKKGILMLVLACLLSFCSGIQSIRQTVVMVCPLVAVEVLRMAVCFFRKEREKCRDRQKLLTVGTITVSNLVGLILIRLVEVNQYEILGSISLNHISDLPGEIKQCIITVLALLLNESALNLSLMAAFLVICAAAFFLMLKKGVASKGGNGLLLLALLVCSVLMIAVIDVMTAMLFASRYYFMLFLLLAYLGAFLLEDGKKTGRAVVLAFSVVLFAVSFAGELLGPCRQVLQREQDPSYEISDYLMENGYTTVFSEWNCGETVAVASGGAVQAGFWLDPDRPFMPMDYLKDVSFLELEPESCIYLFRGEKTVNFAMEAAGNMGVAMTYETYFPASDVYLYTAPVNMLKLYASVQS